MGDPFWEEALYEWAGAGNRRSVVRRNIKGEEECRHEKRRFFDEHIKYSINIAEAPEFGLSICDKYFQLL